MMSDNTVPLQHFSGKRREVTLDARSGNRFIFGIVMTMKRGVIVPIVVLLLGATAGCRVFSGGQPRDVSFEFGTPFTLENGQSAFLQGVDLRITFDSVLRDGRCPSEVNCAEHGPVEIVVVVQQGDGEWVSHEMNPDPALADVGWAPTTVKYEDLTVELQAVEPYPERPEDLQTFDAYKATLVVFE